MVFLSEQPPRTLTRPSVTNMMPQRFPLLGRAFNETMFLGLDRGPWFYSPTIIIIIIIIFDEPNTYY